MEGRSKQSRARARERGHGEEQRCGRVAVAGRRRTLLVEPEGLGGWWLPQSPFSALLLCWPRTLCLVFSVLFIPLHMHALTHTEMHACILKSSSAYATPLCGSLWFSAAVHDAGTSSHLQLHSAGIQLQPVLQRQDWFFKDNIFWGGIFLLFISFPSKKAVFIRREEAWLVDWSCQVLKGSRQVLSTPSIVLLQHFLREQAIPRRFQFSENKVLAEQAPSCSHGETMRNSI